MLVKDEIQAVRALSDRTPLVKAYFYGSNGLVPLDKEQTSPSATAEPAEFSDEYATLFQQATAIEPPYPPDVLCKLLEHSCALRQNIDAYCVNIDGFGYRLVPTIDMDASDVDERIGDAIFAERLLENEQKLDTGDLALDKGQELEDVTEYPDDAEIKKRKVVLIGQMRREKARLESFFNFCALEMSFVELRKITRQDRETLGNGFWEVIRDGKGKMSQLAYVPGFTVRLMPVDEQPTTTEVKIKFSAVDYTRITIEKRFRRFAQVFNNKVVFFKEFGDKRVLSRQHGTYHESVDAMKAKEQDSTPANELIHFKIHSPRTPYGIPRWIGTMLAVLGTRQAEEVNYLYFENKSVPPLALLVSGGRISGKTVDRIASYIENEIKGKRNFHNILVLEAEPAAQSSPMETQNRVRIELRPLTSAQHNDALFQNYDERNVHKVGQSFRLPPMLRGDSRDHNRASATTAKALAEEQVFLPEREDFDHAINFKLMPELNARFWRFASKGPQTTNATELSEILERLVKAKILTINEARQTAEMVVSRELRRIEADWADMPADLLDPKLGIPAPGHTMPDSFEEEFDEDSVDKGEGDMTTGDLGDATYRPQPKKKPGKKKKPKKTIKLASPKVEKNEAGETVETWCVPEKVWQSWFEKD